MKQRLLWLMCASVMVALSLDPSVISAQMVRLKNARFDPLKGTPSSSLPVLRGAVRAAATPANAGEPRLALVQWSGGLSEAGLKALTAKGVKLIQPVPENAYLVAVPANVALGSLVNTGGLALASASTSTIRWAGTMSPAWKLDAAVVNYLQKAAVATAEDATTPTQNVLLPYYVQIAHTGAEKVTIERIKALSRTIILHSQADTYETWKIEADAVAIETIAAMNSVLWIEPYHDMKLMSEREGLSVANLVNSDGSSVVHTSTYAQWLSKVGLSGEGVTVQVMDDGLSQGNSTNLPGTAHQDIIGRIAGIDNATNDALGNSIDGHGHLNASIIMGQPLAGSGLKDKGGYLLGQGVAPKAKVFATKVFTNYFGSFTRKRSTDALIYPAYQGGARISSNSWGADVAGSYVVACQDYDRLTRDASAFDNGLQPMIFVFSAGNDGRSGANSMGAPASAKNVISVGAMENCDRGEVDGSGVGPEGSDDLRDVADFSSRGPMLDGRFGPTVTAPGTHVAGAASDDKDYNGDGVSGRVNLAPSEDSTAIKYYPAKQAYYTWSSGTSHSCPVVAGAAALYYEYYKKKFSVPPSPAMMKAALIAGAIDPAGGQVNNGTGSTLTNIPNNDVGWGRVTLSNLVSDQVGVVVSDQTADTILTFNSQTVTKKITVTDPTKPLHIVLAWTDPPGSLVSDKALVNDLDLTVSDGTNTWLGNVFAKGASKTGGKRDQLNNVECVFLPHPAPAIYTITITAQNLMGDARPGVGAKLEQDFALFASNCGDPTSIGRAMLDKEVYKGSDRVQVSVSDADLKDRGTCAVVVTSKLTGDTEALTLNEVDRPSGVFVANLPLDSTGGKAADGKLQVRNGDTIKVSYTDANANGQSLVSTAQASVDLMNPGFISQVISNVDYQSAKLIVKTYEPTQMVLTYGTTCGGADNKKIQQDNFSTTHEVPLTGLAPNAVYLYYFNLIDQAGNTGDYDNRGRCFAFMTMDQKVIFTDKIESGVGGWTHYSRTGVDDWRIVPSALAASPTHCWFASDSDVAKDTVLLMPTVHLGPQSTLQFFHTYEFESNSVRGLDGGVIEISTDNAQHWADLGPYITAGKYNSVISRGSGNPIEGRQAWSGGVLGKMRPVQVDLSSFAGQDVRIRFRLGCDRAVGSQGWYIDNVQISNAVKSVGDLARIAFDQAGFNPSMKSIRFTLTDLGLSQTSNGYPINFRLASPAIPLGLPVVPSNLKLIDPIGIWEGTLSVAPGTDSKSALVANMLNIKEGESVSLIYTDPSVNGSSQDVTTAAVLDASAPWITNLNTMSVFDKQFTLKIVASEPVIFQIKYGTDPANLNKVVKTSTYSTLEYMTVANLTPCTAYYYQIDLIDKGGILNSYKNEGFYYTIRTGQRVSKTDDFEPRAEFNWAHHAALGTDTWMLEETPFARSDPHAWYAQSTSVQQDASLVLGPIDVGAGELLHFWHTYELEKAFDGAVIEISTDGGNTWTDLGDRITQGGYNFQIATEYGNPIGGRQAWSDGVLGQLTEVIVDLDAYRGTGRLIRWRLTSDKQHMATGWYVDDVTLDTVESCTDAGIPNIPTLVTPTSGLKVAFDQTLTMQWQSTSKATSYKVYLGKAKNSLQLLKETGDTTCEVAAGQLRAGTQYFWRVVAVSTLPAMTPSAVWSFQTGIMDPARIANYIIGKGTLTTQEKRAVDYDDNGVVDVRDLITNINRR